MINLTIQQKLHYTLRLAVAMCFIGHGSFGIITKPIWCNYFALFGIGKVMAYQLMPFLGAFDIALGLIMLIYPVRAIPMWLVLWGIITALLRPLSGEPFAEFIERAGNFGAPFALILLSGGFNANVKSWFSPINPNIAPDTETLTKVITYLKIIVFLLLIGHGWLNIMQKKGLLAQYAQLGFANPGKAAQLMGLFEVVAAITVFVKPVIPLLVIFLTWKVVSELFYPHYELFEWVERGGSYGCILALILALNWFKHPLKTTKSMFIPA